MAKYIFIMLLALNCNLFSQIKAVPNNIDIIESLTSTIAQELIDNQHFSSNTISLISSQNSNFESYFYSLIVNKFNKLSYLVSNNATSAIEITHAIYSAKIEELDNGDYRRDINVDANFTIFSDSLHSKKQLLKIDKKYNDTIDVKYLEFVNNVPSFAKANVIHNKSILRQILEPLSIIFTATAALYLLFTTRSK